MKLLKSLFRGRTRAKATFAKPSHDHPDRVHLFHGTFASELDATDYCLTPIGKNQPEPLTRDLPDATIDTAEVEILFTPTRITAAIPMFSPDPDGLLNRIGTDNTLVMIAEAAFCGLPYSLNDTPVLRYAGPYEVI